MPKFMGQFGWGGVIAVVGGLGGLTVGGVAVFMAGPVPGLIYLAVALGCVWLFWRGIFGPMAEAD